LTAPRARGGLFHAAHTEVTDALEDMSADAGESADQENAARLRALFSLKKMQNPTHGLFFVSKGRSDVPNFFENV
jgi:hypothetical protein